MITDQQTNKVYISALLKIGYGAFYEQLIQLFDQHNIDCKELYGTKDIWVRDFMPVQKHKKKCILFMYDPDYLKGAEFDNIRTVQGEIAMPKDFEIENRQNIIIDGGNIVKGDRKVIITDKVFKDNNKKYNQYQLLKELEGILNGDEIIFIPPEPGDYTGHADGLVRFLDDNTVFVSEHTLKQRDNITGKQAVSISYAQKLYGALAWAGLDIIQIPSFYTNLKYESAKGRMDLTALGNYINYLQVGNKIFVPQYFKRGFEYNIAASLVQETDERAMEKFRKVYTQHEIIPLDSLDIALKGGVLNCITWNVLESVKIDPSHIKK